MTYEEYLEKKQACADCLAHGDPDHCASTLLSREQNCLFYNNSAEYGGVMCTSNNFKASRPELVSCHPQRKAQYAFSIVAFYFHLQDSMCTIWHIYCPPINPFLSVLYRFFPGIAISGAQPHK